MIAHTLQHWDEARDESVEMHVHILTRDIRIVEADFEPRMVIVELRDNGTLAVLIYPKNQNEPIMVLLPETGSHLIQSDAPLLLNADNSYEGSGMTNPDRSPTPTDPRHGPGPAQLSGGILPKAERSH